MAYELFSTVSGGATMRVCHHRRSRGAPPVLLVLLGLHFVWACVATGDGISRKDNQRVGRGTSAQQTVQTRQLIEALVTRNPSPTLTSKGLIFDPKYDRLAAHRAWEAVPRIVSHVEEAWPLLVGHLDDERYCLTVRPLLSGGAPQNWSVGKMCHEIVARNLSEAYLRNLAPITKSVYLTMVWPNVARDAKKLKIWCDARKDKELYELQIEMCQWAITEVPNLRKTPLQTRRTWSRAIEAEIRSLQESKKAVLFSGFGTEEIGLAQPDK